jgi:alpha-N-arabinofuranosidase
VSEGLGKVQAKGTVTVLRSDKLSQENTFANPKAISPVVQPVNVKNNRVKMPVPSYSVNVVKVRFPK